MEVKQAMWYHLHYRVDIFKHITGLTEESVQTFVLAESSEKITAPDCKWDKSQHSKRTISLSVP